MRYILFAVFLFAGILPVAAGDGYKVQVKFTDIKDTTIYLAHYYGEPLPTIFVTDSIRLDNTGQGSLVHQEKISGGIYLILLPDRQHYFELLLENGDSFGITATANKLPDGVTYTNSPANDRYLSYVSLMNKYGKAQEELSRAKAKAETDAAKAKVSAAGQSIRDFRSNYITKYPGSLLANIFKALDRPQVPAGKHYLSNGKEDTLYAFNYYKAHYWDNFNLHDDRLVYTPLYQSRLVEYIDELTAPKPDSMQKEADMLLARTKGSREMYKYTLWWLTQHAQNSNVMGMDQAFVYLVENYFMKGEADWVDKELLAQYADRARKIAPNVIGNIGADIKMVDINKVEHTLYNFDAKYTLLVFWSPECGGCRAMMPKIDSVYDAALKKRGVKVYAVRTDGDEKEWMKFVKENGMEDWMHVYDPEHKSNYRAKYDVYGTPVIYLLDEKKIIRGKKLDPTNIVQVLDILQEQEKATTKKS